MKKIKEFMKSYTLGFVISILLCGTVGVYAATYIESNLITYDNKDSGMNSDNVQTAIDELYNTCFPPKAGDQILEDQPLEKDEYECRYFFTGGNPNNYITFNDEKARWRIISVECDGRIKIMRIASIGDMAWDTDENNNWARPASLNTYLNGTYYNSLNSTAKSQIVASNFSIGAVTNGNNNMSTQVSNENSKTWKGKVALPTVSEFIRTNSNKSSCGTLSLMNSNSSRCVSTGWMDTTSVLWWWTLSSYAGDSYRVFNVGSSGFVRYNDYAGDTGRAVRPAITLSSEVQITGGDGSWSNPYTIE